MLISNKSEKIVFDTRVAASKQAKFFLVTLKIVFSYLILSSSAFAINTVATGFRVVQGSTVEIDAHGTCHKVTNNGSRDQFVPTKTLTQWNNFIANKPSALSLSACLPPCGPTSNPGDVCPGGAIYLGSLSPGAISGSGTDHYMTTPGGCTNIPAGSVSGGSGASSYANAHFTPESCSGTDATNKYWNDGSINYYDISNLVNYTGTSGTGTGTSNTDQNYGSYNTSEIIKITALAQGGYHAAARYCDKLSYGGYTDWYLPNRYELNLMWTNKANIPGLATGTYDYYWSSTEHGANFSWRQRFSDGNQDSTGKLNPYRVRCVRKFETQ